MQSVPQVPQTAQQSPEHEILRDYDNLLMTFYNYAPILDRVNITTAYAQCKRLLALADLYDALPVVGPRIDHHLLQFQTRLWKQIAKYPPSYLKLGYLARSKVIFAEALCHVVGQWPAGAPQLRTLPRPVYELIEDKADELEDLKTRVDVRLFRLNPTTARGDRVTPSTAYIDWLALSLFRQWLADNTAPSSIPLPQPKQTSTITFRDSTQHPHKSQSQSQSQPQSQIPPPSSGRMYRLLGAGGPAYLAHDELKKFLKLRPEEYSREVLRKLERRMEDIKALAREVVRPLIVNELQFDAPGMSATSTGAGAGMAMGMGYLTCSRCEEEDFPW